MIKVPPKLSFHENRRLRHSFYMQDWEFDAIFLPKCTEVDSCIIGWKGSQAVYAKLYGVNAKWTKTDLPCLSNFFIRYEHRVYQCGNVRYATDILQLLSKEFEYDEYEHKLWKQRYEINQKKREQQKKAKIRKLNAA